MTIYRNTNWTRRDYEATNVVYQIAADDQQPRRFNGQLAPEGEWVPADAIPADMQKLGMCGGIEFYGYL